MNYTESKAPKTTITYNREDIAEKANNIFEAIVVIGKRAEQISIEIKNELNQKLDDFASHTESLDEVFENREQIEVSKYYESLPKPQAIAVDEWNQNQIYMRKTEDSEAVIV